MLEMIKLAWMFPAIGDVGLNDRPTALAACPIASRLVRCLFARINCGLRCMHPCLYRAIASDCAGIQTAAQRYWYWMGMAIRGCLLEVSGSCIRAGLPRVWGLRFMRTIAHAACMYCGPATGCSAWFCDTDTVLSDLANWRTNLPTIHDAGFNPYLTRKACRLPESSNFCSAACK